MKLTRVAWIHEFWFGYNRLNEVHSGSTKRLLINEQSGSGKFNVLIETWFKVAVAQNSSFTSLDADGHLLSVNNSVELKCLLEIEADDAVHRKVTQFSRAQNFLACSLHEERSKPWSDGYQATNNSFLVFRFVWIEWQDDGSFCSTSFDGILCWPRTRIDTVLTQPCFSEMRGIQYYVTSKYH